jgi:hypothetical protein
MTSVWVPVVGTLSGAIVGGLGGLAGQWLQWRRDRTTRWDASRKETYAQFLTAGERSMNALWSVAYSIARKYPGEQVSERWRPANAHLGDLKSHSDVIQFLANTETASAAGIVVAELEKFRTEVFTKQRSHEAFETEAEYRTRFYKARDEFVSAAKRELGIAPARHARADRRS